MSQRGDGFTNDTLANAVLAADIAENKKGEEVVILDMRDVTLIADYFVIVSAMSVTQVESIADAIQEALSGRGLERLNRVGSLRAHWVLLDYGGVVVHIFTEAERQYYNLERLWGDAKPVDRDAVAASHES